jgi:hypothetical protein
LYRFVREQQEYLSRDLYQRQQVRTQNSLWGWGELGMGEGIVDLDVMYISYLILKTSL